MSASITPGWADLATATANPKALYSRLLTASTDYHEDNGMIAYESYDMEMDHEYNDMLQRVVDSVLDDDLEACPAKASTPPPSPLRADLLACRHDGSANDQSKGFKRDPTVPWPQPWARMGLTTTYTGAGGAGSTTRSSQSGSDVGSAPSLELNGNRAMLAASSFTSSTTSSYKGPLESSPDALVDLLFKDPSSGLSDDALLQHAASCLEARCMSAGDALCFVTALRQRICSTVTTSQHIQVEHAKCIHGYDMAIKELQRQQQALVEDLTAQAQLMQDAFLTTNAAYNTVFDKSVCLRQELSRLQADADALAPVAELGRVFLAGQAKVQAVAGCSSPEALVALPVLEIFTRAPSYSDGTACVYVVEDPVLAQTLVQRAQLIDECAKEESGMVLSPSVVPTPGRRADVLDAGAKIAAMQPGSAALNRPTCPRLIIKAFPYATKPYADRIAAASAADPSHPLHRRSVPRLEHVQHEAANAHMAHTLATGAYVPPLMCATTELRGPCKATAFADRQLVLVYPFEDKGDLNKCLRSTATAACQDVVEALRCSNAAAAKAWAVEAEHSAAWREAQLAWAAAQGCSEGDQQGHDPSWAFALAQCREAERLAADLELAVAAAVAAAEALAQAVPAAAERVVAEVQDSATGVCRVMAQTHDLGIVLNDAKPGNFIKNASGRVKGIDVAGLRATEEGQGCNAICEGGGIGTAGFLAPEREKCAGFASDVYAAGAVVTHLLHYAISIFEGQGPDLAGPLSSALETAYQGSRLKAVAQACLRQDPFARPTAGEALFMLL
ncbi:hypothetical protein HYH03_006286 [Edaphochlamys debaryana]|uniref:Protein kinase domain-containing protein n=1 Tax=Edaphochlamys debaryana TaxID=47281 RepID=A0A836C0C6_9CHLO|nr:hypothetical protein HYH03_006286 [Edaphochlamys debaryana]|eukprot:KAG2495686.1 hypothetical protein HYH03_006286 [Edaphochlamys debaryana]